MFEKNSFYRIIFILVLVISCRSTDEKEEWISLFNGEDLTGWDTFLSYQPGSENTSILGVNNDPDGIFTVVDGTIRVDGKIWGALTSKNEFEKRFLELKGKSEGVVVYVLEKF